MSAAPAARRRHLATSNRSAGFDVERIEIEPDLLPA
jgi:hypothetical protein